MANTNQILVKGIKSGDRALYKALFMEFSPALNRYSQSITGDREASRELVQDLFLEIWENRSDISITGSLKAYLFSAIYHKSLNWLRSDKIRIRYAQHPVGIQNWFPGFNKTEPDDPLRLDIIESEIKRLPDRCREVFTRAVILGDKLQEIAALLGLSEKTVENHLARARRILRSRLKKIR